MEVFVSAIPTRVRGRPWTRHRAEHDAARGLVVCTSAGGPPTLWQGAQEIVVSTFRSALGEPPEDALRGAYAAARAALLRFRAALVGRSLPEVMLLAIALRRGRAELAVGGAARVYLHQRRQHRRLTAVEDLMGGLADNPEPFLASTPVQPGDLLVAGSLEAFELPAIGAMAARLETDPTTPVDSIARILLSPAEASGVGASVGVIRVGTD